MENSVQRRQKEKDTPKIPVVSKSEKEAKILNDQSQFTPDLSSVLVNVDEITK